MSNAQIELAGEEVYATEKAYLIDFGLLNHVWVPKQYAEYQGDHIWLVREWVAKEKGLL